jgi:hypothetical protein
MLAASASVSLLDAKSFGSAPALKGYGSDPKLLEVHQPGEFWPLTLTSEQRQTVAALCDVIIPADDRSPSASQVHVHDFIDEWISAPYPRQREDRKIVLDGLRWLERESKKRFQKTFTELDYRQKQNICDDICFEPKAQAGFKKAAAFFARFRDLTASGFYTTPEGMKDIQYVGNVALEKWDGAPKEVLEYLKLE